MVKISEIFSSSSQTSVPQDPTITCNQKCYFFLKFVLEMAALEHFG